jgi:hypothetical protein
MNALGTLLAVFGILVVGGASYELYNKTKSHHRTKHHRHKHHGISKSHSKSSSRSGNDFFGLFKKSRKNKNKKLSYQKSRKLSPRTSRKLFNIFKQTINDKSVSKKLKSVSHKKHTPTMTSSEKRQYYLNKFKHNVHKTKKRRRRIYI